MNIKSIFIAVAVASLLMIPMPPGSAWAGSEGGLPPAGGISGPELWGTVVVDCGAQRATLRVKGVADCNVETAAFSMVWLLCPATEKSPLYFVLTGVNLTSMGITGTPVITKVKNFKVEGSLVSFDVQIRSTP
jgi:hypothetical protein